MSAAMRNDLPISEQYRLAAEAWVDADSAASLMEETKSTTFAQMVIKLIGNSKMAVNRAELTVKASKEWFDFIELMVRLRKEANKLKIPMDVLRMQAMEQQSQEATRRAEMRV